MKKQKPKPNLNALLAAIHDNALTVVQRSSVTAAEAVQYLLFYWSSLPITARSVPDFTGKDANRYTGEFLCRFTNADGSIDWEEVWTSRKLTRALET